MRSRFRRAASKWIGGALKTLAPPDAVRGQGNGQVIEVDFGKPRPRRTPRSSRPKIVEHVNLNSSRSDKETIHLALSFDGAMPAYEPGDSLDLYAENDPAYVDELLEAAPGLPATTRCAPT